MTTTPNTYRVSFACPPELWREVKLEAVKRGQPIHEYAAELLRRGIEADRQKD